MGKLASWQGAIALLQLVELHFRALLAGSEHSAYKHDIHVYGCNLVASHDSPSRRYQMYFLYQPLGLHLMLRLYELSGPVSWGLRLERYQFPITTVVVCWIPLPPVPDSEAEADSTDRLPEEETPDDQCIRCLAVHELSSCAEVTPVDELDPATELEQLAELLADRLMAEIRRAETVGRVSA